MKKKQRGADSLWLKRLGIHIDALIRKKGYESPYDFWVRRIGDDISRTTLNHVLTGKYDPKASTLKKIADHLNLKLSDLVDF